VARAAAAQLVGREPHGAHDAVVQARQAWCSPSWPVNTKRR
jgi:hypothetical protein